MFKSKRSYVNILVFGSFLFLPMVPWWVPFIIGIVAAWYFNYYELMLLAFLMDIAYGSAYFFSFFSFGFALPFTVLAAAIILVLETLKKRIR